MGHKRNGWGLGGAPGNGKTRGLSCTSTVWGGVKNNACFKRTSSCMHVCIHRWHAGLALAQGITEYIAFGPPHKQTCVAATFAATVVLCMALYRATISARYTWIPPPQVDKKRNGRQKTEDNTKATRKDMKTHWLKVTMGKHAFQEPSLRTPKVLRTPQ